jgi:hypothetical protein
MNELNTQQIILLCLLVSFVTSIATGITTVSLLEQAPEPVTQTINRVVERTIERVVESPNDDEENSSPETVIERVVETVVVNQEDLTVEAVAKNKDIIVGIYGLDRFENTFFAGNGIVVSETGDVLTDSVVTNQADTFVIEYPDASATSSVSTALGQNAVLLKPLVPLESSVVVAAFGDSQSIKLGQTIIIRSGSNSPTVATGIVTKLETAQGVVTADDATASTVPETPIIKIHTSTDASGISAGALLLNLKGEVIGVRVGQVAGISTFLPSNIAKSLLIQ